MSFAKLLLALFIGMCAATGAAADAWIEGTNYFVVNAPNWHATKPGKAVVTEVFSYGCPACNSFLPTMQKIRAELPPETEYAYVPAGFVPTEDWLMFQRAYCTAQVLHIADKTHAAMFDAVWATGELATADPVTHQLKKKMPTIEDAAKFYHRLAGVSIEDFLSAASSFSVDNKIREADQYIAAYAVVGTPTIIVNGRYRTDPAAAGGYDQLVSLVKWLVIKDGDSARVPAQDGAGR